MIRFNITPTFKSTLTFHTWSLLFRILFLTKMHAFLIWRRNNTALELKQESEGQLLEKQDVSSVQWNIQFGAYKFIAPCCSI
jgi:hypothetical protein